MKKSLLLVCAAGFASIAMGGRSFEYIFDIKMDQTTLEQGSKKDKITLQQQNALLRTYDLSYETTGTIIFYSKGQITTCDATISPDNYNDENRAGKIAIAIMVNDAADIYDRTLMVFGSYENSKNYSEPLRAADPDAVSPSYISVSVRPLNSLSATGSGTSDLTATGIICGINANLRFNKNLSTDNDPDTAMVNYLSQKTGLTTNEVSAILYE